MLGFRDINGGICSEDQALRFVEFMKLNKVIFEAADSNYIRNIYLKDNVFNLYAYYDIKFAFVSDSLIITYYPKEFDEHLDEKTFFRHSANALFIATIRMQTFIYHCFKEKGIYLRGGISNKYCYVEDGFAVGEGLIEAYKAESSLAKYPRIILDPSVMSNKMLASGINFISKKMYSDRGILSLDTDGVYFIDYIGYAISIVDDNLPMVAEFKKRSQDKYWMTRGSVDEFISSHGQMIAEKIAELDLKESESKISNADKVLFDNVRSKYVWLKKYHNKKIRGTDFAHLGIA